MKKIICTIIIILFSVKYASADSLWERATKIKEDNSLYTDEKADKVGDIITVLIVEEAFVSQKAASSTSRESNIKGEVKDWFNLNFHHGPQASSNTGTLPKWEIDATNEFSGGGTYSGDYVVKGQVTTQVVEVLPNGNLVIEGESLVRNNEEVNTIAISGIVRPQDIGNGNTVLSTLVADKKLFVKGKGPLNDKTNRGILGKLLDWVWPF